MSLYKKYVAVTASVTMILMGVFSWILFDISREQIYSDDKQRVELITEIIRNGLKAIMLEGSGGKEFQKFLNNVIAKDIETVRIFSENGTVFNSTLPGEIGKRVDEKYLRRYRSHEDTSVFIQEQDGSRMYSSIFVIKNDWPCQKCHGGWEKIRGILGVEVSTDAVGRSLSRIKTLLICSYLIGAVLLVLSLSLLGRYFIKSPVDVLLRSLKNIEKGDLALKIPVNSKDEMGEISSSMNTIVAELGRCKDEVRTFSIEKDKYVKKMVSLGEAAATVAHEIKNPLAGISGALQVIAEDIPADNPGKEICSDILKEIERLDNAVKDMLAYAKTPEPHLILTDINAIIERVCRVITIQAQRDDVEITTVLDALPEVMVDPQQLEIAFMNITRNSLHLMSDGGVLTMITHHREDAREIEIAFSDTGGGMPEETLADVFKPFFATQQLGTGLKMAISRNIIENHKGRIEVQSKTGIGNTFSIIIPYTE